MGANWWSKNIPSESLDYARSAMEQGLFSMGPRVVETETLLGRALGYPTIKLTNSGTSACIMALLALGIGPKDHVIVPSLTWVASGQAAAILGASVSVVDVEYDSLCLSPDGLTEAFRPNTKAIVVVYFNGHSPRIAEIEELANSRGIKIVEDRCKALGTTFRQAERRRPESHLATFSLGMFSPVSIGYGGAIASPDRQRDNQLTLLRDHGVDRSDDSYKYLSQNFKVSDILASLAPHQIMALRDSVGCASEQELAYATATDGSQYGQVVKHKGLDVGTYVMFLADSKLACDDVLRKARVNRLPLKRYHPPIHRASYFDYPTQPSVASDLQDRLIHLPSGPGVSERLMNEAIDCLV